MVQVHTHIMFQGEAEEAVRLYDAIFDTFEVQSTERYGAGESFEAGTFRLASVRFSGQSLIIFNSPPMHDFTFTPAMSLYVDLESREAFEAAFERLSEGGEILMPVGDYGFSPHFYWLKDRFGLSWQLSLPDAA